MPAPISSIDIARSFIAASYPVTGRTGCVRGPDPPPRLDPPPIRGAGVADGPAAGVEGAEDEGTEDDGADADGCADVDVPARGAGCPTGCGVECEASRMATLSSATVKVTRRLNRITSTRNALVCTV